jgi:hypothetical protein
MGPYLFPRWWLREKMHCYFFIARVLKPRDAEGEARIVWGMTAKAVGDYGYSQMEWASFLELQYSAISRILAITAKQKK